MTVTRRKKRLESMLLRSVVALLGMLLCGVGCQISIVDPGKDPKDPKPSTNPTQSLSNGVFVAGEGADTRVDYVDVQRGADGGAESVYVLGRFRYIAHFGDLSIVSRGENGAFLAKLDHKGGVVWVKSFVSDVTPGGLALSPKGEPIIALNVGEVKVVFDNKEIDNAYGAHLISYDTEGRELRRKQFEGRGIYGLRSSKDGALAIRRMVMGGNITFGRTRISSITRMETVFLGRLSADWEPQWALHMHSAYSNGLQPHIHFAFDQEGNLWFAGNNKMRFPDVGDALPQEYKGGAFLLKLGVDGTILWSAVGSAITGHGQHFGQQTILSLDVTADGFVHLLGSSNGGIFGGKALDAPGLFHFSFSREGEWKQSDVQRAAPPLDDVVRTMALLPNGRVVLWGKSDNLSFLLPNGEKISPTEPHLQGVWSPSAQKMSWWKEARKETFEQVFVVSESALIQVGLVRDVAGDASMPESGVNVFIEQVTPPTESQRGRVVWHTQSAGKSALFPLQTSVLGDGSRLVLVEWNGRRDVGDASQGDATRYLLHLDRAGKLLHQRSFSHPSFALTADGLLSYHKQLSAPARFDTRAGVVDVQAGHLVVVYEDPKGQSERVIVIPAQGANVTHIASRAAGGVILAGAWDRSGGRLGTFASPPPASRTASKGFVACFSKEGKQEWVLDLDLDAVVVSLSHLFVSQDEHILLAGALYPATFSKEARFGTKTIDTEGGGSTVSVVATISPKGELLSAQNTTKTLCSWSRMFVTMTPQGHSYLSGLCGFSGKQQLAVAKLDKDGQILWKKTFDGKGDISLGGAVLGVGDQLHLVGGFTETLQLGGKEITAQGQRDVFLASFSAEGMLSNLSAFGGTLDDRVWSVAIQGEQLVLSGTTRGKFQVGGVTFSSGGGLLMFTVDASLTSIHKTSF